MSTSPAPLLQSVAKWSIVLAVILIVFGFLAIAAPLFASVGVALAFAWLLMLNGITQLIYAFRSKGVGRIIWKVLVACFYVVAGGWLLTHPLLGLAGLTLVLTVFFFAEGITDVVVYFFSRRIDGAGWMLLDGIITILLAVMIWRHWPSSSAWALGTLVGVSMLMTGTTRLMMALAVRRHAKNSAGPTLVRNPAA